VTPEPSIRREIRAGDLEAIVAHHGRLYAEEYGVDSDFESHVASAVARAAARGFPNEREAIWLVGLDGEHAGSLALTDEGEGEAAVRWFVLNSELRGRGLGRRLLDELLARAAQVGYRRVWLETFSDLEVAAHLYRDHGFELVSTDARPRWGRDRIAYQRYELELSSRPALDLAK
jgi:ribosomal protein S18 acetylase RimI-like enzyme